MTVTDRREFFSLFLGRKERGRDFLRPPGAVLEKDFLKICNGCGDCAKACPYKSIVMALGLPLIVPKVSPCYLCDGFPCVKSCRVGALRDVESQEQVRMGSAFINQKHCTAFGEMQCQFCFIKCPLSGKAIRLEDFKPVIQEDSCTGCGVCEHVCATVNDQAPIKVVRAGTLPFYKQKEA